VLILKEGSINEYMLVLGLFIGSWV